jgi:dTMP kinase
VKLPSTYRPLYYDGPRQPFIVLEGVSGIGKSTLARALAKRLGAASLHTLPAPHTDWSDLVNKRLRALPQFAFYLSGLLHAADSVRYLQAAGPIVADRYVSSVIACHAAVHDIDVQAVAQLLEPFRSYLPTPTRTFYLACSEAALRERLAAKHDTKQDDLDLFAVPGRLARLLADFQAVQTTDPTAVAVDTDGRTPDDLADWITALVEARVLNPIDTESVIRDGGAVGRFPGEIHEGVAWWLGACFVVVRGASQLVVGHDGHPTTAEFYRRFRNGAVNARHFACKVTAAGQVMQDDFLALLRARGSLGGAYLATESEPGLTQVVRIRLYDGSGQPIQEDTGLARIRAMIAEDRVPIPVSGSAKGTIEPFTPNMPGATE